MGAFELLGEFSDAQPISADDTASTSTIDLGKAKPQIGVGKEAPFLCIQTAVAPTDAGDTLSIEVQIDDDDGAGAPSGSWAALFMPLVGANGAEVAATDARLATAGAWIYRAPLPYEVNKRHLRLMYRNTTSNGVFTISAWLSSGPPSDLVFRYCSHL